MTAPAPNAPPPPTTPPATRRVVRALEGLLALGLSVAVFGGVVPFTLLAVRLVPSFGLGNVIYLGAGAALGLAIGVGGVTRTLRGDELLPRRYLGFVLPLALAVLASALAARYFDAFAHV